MSDIGNGSVIPPVAGNGAEQKQKIKDLLTLEKPRVYSPLAFWSVLLLVILFGLGAFFITGFGQGANKFYQFLLTFFSALGVFTVLGFSAGLLRFPYEAGNLDGFRQIAEPMADGVLVIDQKGSSLYANPAYFDILQLQQTRIPPDLLSILSSDHSLSEPLFRLRQALLRNEAWDEEFRVPLKQGRTAKNIQTDQLSLNQETAKQECDEPAAQFAWLRVSIQPLQKKHDDTNDTAQSQFQKRGVPAAVWHVSDITRERTRQEHLYARLDGAIRQFDTAPVGFFTANLKGDVEFMNTTLLSWLEQDGWQGERLRLKDFLSDFESDMLLKLISEPLVEGEDYQVSLYTKSDVKKLATVRLNRLEHFEDIGRFGVITTLRQERRKKPRGDDQSQFMDWFRAAPVGIATLDKDGVLQNANTLFISMLGPIVSGQDEKNLLASRLSEESGKLFLESLERTRQGKGKYAPIEISYGEKGKFLGRLFLSETQNAKGAGEAAYIAYIIDTTQQKTLEQQFAQSQKMQAIGQLAGGIAHDFNNMLTAIIGGSDMLLSSHGPTDRHFQDIMDIKQNANRAAVLVRQLLAFSRQQTMRSEVLLLNNVISNLETTMLSRLLGERIKLKFEQGRDLWPVKTDLHQLEQVIMNLALNARDAMGKGGTLTIETRNISENESKNFDYPGFRRGEYVLCKISDTGSGMPPEVLEKIFEPFFTTKEVGKGTGLGLSMVYGIIKQTDGFIFPESKLGKGTSFSIFLKRCFEEDIPAQPSEENAAPKETHKDLTGSETILLVEDEDAVRNFAVRALTARGYEVLTASTGQEALDVIEDHGGALDLVISDVVMPEMDGPTMLKSLRASYPNIKVIFMSGYAEEAFSRNLEENETFTFLAKPFSLKKLAEIVKEVLEQS